MLGWSLRYTTPLPACASVAGAKLASWACVCAVARAAALRAGGTASLSNAIPGVEGSDIAIRTPLIDMTKAEIVAEAARLGLDAGASWSCYDPTPDLKHCGLCDSCRLRAKGFADAGIPDPTDYAVLDDPA